MYTGFARNCVYAVYLAPGNAIWKEMPDSARIGVFANFQFRNQCFLFIDLLHYNLQWYLICGYTLVCIAYLYRTCWKNYSFCVNRNLCSRYKLYYTYIRFGQYPDRRHCYGTRERLECRLNYVQFVCQWRSNKKDNSIQRRFKRNCWSDSIICYTPSVSVCVAVYQRERIVKAKPTSNDPIRPTHTLKLLRQICLTGEDNDVVKHCSNRIGSGLTKCVTLCVGAYRLHLGSASDYRHTSVLLCVHEFIRTLYCSNKETNKTKDSYWNGARVLCIQVILHNYASEFISWRSQCDTVSHPHLYIKLN